MFADEAWNDLFEKLVDDLRLLEAVLTKNDELEENVVVAKEGGATLVRSVEKAKVGQRRGRRGMMRSMATSETSGLFS